jgi:hypothetical protein
MPCKQSPIRDIFFVTFQSEKNQLDFVSSGGDESAWITPRKRVQLVDSYRFMFLAWRVLLPLAGRLLHAFARAACR